LARDKPSICTAAGTLAATSASSPASTALAALRRGNPVAPWEVIGEMKEENAWRFVRCIIRQ